MPSGNGHHMTVRKENHLSRSVRMAAGLFLRHAPLTVILLLGSSIPLRAQIELAGQASSALLRSDDHQSQYAYDHGKTTFSWRLDLFGNAMISDDVSFHSSLRLYQDQSYHVDLFDLSFTHATALNLTVDVGEIELPVGNLAERRFPMKNPFYNLPLMNEHYTSLRSSNYSLWPYDARYASAGDGIRLLDRGLYDLGVKVSGSFGIADLSLAVINGTVSSTSVYANGGLNGNSADRFGFILRIAATPVTGFTFGTSLADGHLSSAQVPLYTSAGYQYGVFNQYLLEADAEYAVGHLVLDGQFIDNVWHFDDGITDDLKALGYSFEGSYTFVPRCSVSLRVGGIFFNSINEGIPVAYDSLVYYRHYSGQWDHTVTRIEAAFGYRLTREALLKIIYHWDDSIGLTPDPLEQLLILQAVVSF